MGYRSEVVIVVAAPLVAEFEQQCPTLCAVFDTQYRIEDEHKLYNADHIKWYDDFVEIQEWNRWQADRTNHGVSEVGDGYKFARVGEDDNDLEWCGDLDVDVYIVLVRRISFPGPLLETTLAPSTEVCAASTTEFTEK